MLGKYDMICYDQGLGCVYTRLGNGQWLVNMISINIISMNMIPRLGMCLYRARQWAMVGEYMKIYVINEYDINEYDIEAWDVFLSGEAMGNC